MSKRLVIALGGNALGKTPQEQLELVKGTASTIVDLVEGGYDVVIGHGNGPQVGMVNLAFEYSANNGGGTPAMPFPECGAMTQGYTFVEDAGRGYRRVVPSPIPVKIVELPIVEQLVSLHSVVITVGGGGIPVMEKGPGDYEGVAAVIDKDRASAKLALDLNADMLVILTAVEKVSINFNKPDQKDLDSMTIAEARQYIAEGHFAPGSMLPKVESCISFVENTTGGTALITSLDKAREALQGKTGTILTK